MVCTLHIHYTAVYNLHVSITWYNVRRLEMMMRCKDSSSSQRGSSSWPSVYESHDDWSTDQKACIGTKLYLHLDLCPRLHYNSYHLPHRREISSQLPEYISAHTIVIRTRTQPSSDIPSCKESPLLSQKGGSNSWQPVYESHDWSTYQKVCTVTKLPLFSMSTISLHAIRYITTRNDDNHVSYSSYII